VSDDFFLIVESATPDPNVMELALPIMLSVLLGLPNVMGRGLMIPSDVNLVDVRKIQITY
jgi:hypothetical protein